MQIFNNNPLLALFLIISIGYLIGLIHVKGFSLDSSGVLFVALLAGFGGVQLPKILKVLGLCLFIYAIALQSGPGFLKVFRSDGLVLNVFAIGIVVMGALIAILGSTLGKLPLELSIGMFSGALTSTPGLAAAQEATGSDLTAIGYGVAYPIGVLTVIIYIRLLPLLFKRWAITETTNQFKGGIRSILARKAYLVTNSNIYHKKIGDLQFRKTTGCIISRIKRENEIIIPSGDERLLPGDKCLVIGNAKQQEIAEVMLGKAVEEQFESRDILVSRLIVSNKKIIGKKLKELNFNKLSGAVVTRIYRSGVEFPPSPDFKLEFGDRLTVVLETTIAEQVKKIIGNDIKSTSAGNIYSIVLGIAIGILIGMLPVSFGNTITFRLGLTGGVLIAGIILSNLSKTGPFIWRAPSHIIDFMREMGLVLFLSSVGTASGGSILPVIQTHGFSVLLWSFLIALIPMVMITIIYLKYAFNSLGAMAGIITGGMTSTPGLGAAVSLSESNQPLVLYAAVYPIAMLAMIVVSKIMALFV